MTPINARMTRKIFLLCLIYLNLHLTHSVTVNPDQDEATTVSSQRNWKSTFHRNNKEIKFIPTRKEESKKLEIELPAIKEDGSPLSRANVFGQRKQNLENSPSEEIKAKRVNYLSSFRSRNNSKVNATKESNKIDIILLPQDEGDESTTRSSSYRRRYRKNKNRQHHKNSEKQAEDTGKHMEDEDKSETLKENEKTSGSSKNDTNEELPINRLFSKNKRRLYGNRIHTNKINKEAAEVHEKQSEEDTSENKEKIEKNVVQKNTSKYHDKNGYKIDLNGNKEEIENSNKENKEHRGSKDEDKPKESPSEESSEETPVHKVKEYEKTEKLIQKYRVPTVSTLATPIEILSTYPSSNYFENNSYNKFSSNGLSNMQLLHTLGMRKVRQPNHHNKRHQQDSSKSRSQYNINSDSQMYIVKLPPQPYYYLNEKSSYNIKPKNNLPIKMVNNGKIDKVYHYNLPLVEKLMTGRKTYNNKVHRIHDPVQPYFGPYSQNEYEAMTKKPLENKKLFASNKNYDSDSSNGNSYYRSEASHDHKKVIPVHEENTSFEQSDKQLDTRHDYNRFSPSEEFSKYKDDFKNFDPSDEYKKFDAQEHYNKFNEKKEYDKFNPTDDFKSFDTKYNFEKFKPDSDFKAFESTDEFNKFKVSKPLVSYSSKGKGSSHQDSKIINIKPSLGFGSSSHYDGNTIPSFSDKNYRHFDRVMSSSVSPIYMKPYVHRYYTNNGRPKSIYVLPQYHKT